MSEDLEEVIPLTVELLSPVFDRQVAAIVVGRYRICEVHRDPEGEVKVYLGDLNWYKSPEIPPVDYDDFVEALTEAKELVENSSK